MSNKKRRNKQAADEVIGSGLTDSTRNQPGEMNIPSSQTIPTASTGGSNLLSYIKTHLWLVGVICFLSLGVLGAGLKYLDESAQREIARRNAAKGNLNNFNDKSQESFLNKVNPFLTDPPPAPTPQLSKEYIYAGSRMLAVEDANASSAPPADLAIWRPDTGTWWVMGSSGSQQAVQQWGVAADKPVPGDYDGDGKTDFAVWRAAEGNWYIINSSGGGGGQLGLGSSGDLPAQADFDGDGKTDAAVFRPSTGVWYIQQSSNYQVVQGQFGTTGDVPAAADYDGDGKADIGVWRSSDKTFYSRNSSDGAVQYVSINQTGDPVSADYDGDGKADYAIYNASSATWYIRQSTNGQIITTQLGSANDIPVPNDYDGDGKVDIAVWHASNGVWTIKQTASGTTRTAQWGGTFNGIADIPVPALYRR